MIKGDKNQQELANLHHVNAFPSRIYMIDKPEYLDIIRGVSEKLLRTKKQTTKINKFYPVMMTDNIYSDSDSNEFNQYILDTAWGILAEEGYDMTNKATVFSEIWCQEHHKGSGQEPHVHGYGSQLSGFYFLNVPNDYRVSFHDPRLAKVQINLPETDITALTVASNIINYPAIEGRFMFTNSWLTHAFPRNVTSKPLRFIHFNILVVQTADQQPTQCNIEKNSPIVV